MEPYPHRYRARAEGASEGDLEISSQALPRFATAPPREFGGPGNLWSPETLLVAAVADCFVLTFRAIARASKLRWTRLACACEGVLDRVDGITRFTELHLQAELTLREAADADRARRLLEKAESTCLVSNSLSAARTLECRIEAD